jgi:flagellar biosynthesis/type III secretory pathway M-ring protein FliF/YscJ
MEENLTLKDIRSLEPIDDISLYLFIIAIVFVSLIIGALLYKLFSTMRARKKEVLRKEVLQRLKDIEFDDPKDASYKITKYARFLADDEQSKRMLEQLLPKLEKYKFIKNVPEFDDESIRYYNLFLKSVDE